MHPVAQVLDARRRSGSVADGHRVALVIEGGGMRGVVSAAMVASIERLGLSDAFDLIVGSSAGAINGSALLAGSGRQAVAAYCGPLASRAFVNPLRILRGKPVLDVDDIFRIAGLARGEILSGRGELHCVATDVATAKAVDLTGFESDDEAWTAVLASSRMPWVGGPPVRFRGQRFLDGGLIAPVPVDCALAAGATHVLALQTRPYGVARTSGSRLADRMIERHLAGLNPALVDLYHGRIAAYDAIVAAISRRSRAPGSQPPHVLGVRPLASTACVGQLEREPDVLRAAASDAERLLECALRVGERR